MNSTTYGLHIPTNTDILANAVTDPNNPNILDAAAGHIWHLNPGQTNEEVWITCNAVYSGGQWVKKAAAASAAIRIIPRSVVMLMVDVTATPYSAGQVITWQQGTTLQTDYPVLGTGAAQNTALNPSVTGAVPIIPCYSNAPSVAPYGATTNVAAIAGDLTNNALWVYINGAWRRTGILPIPVRWLIQGNAVVANKVVQALMDRPGTFTQILMWADTAPAGAALSIRVNRNGTQVATASIAAGANSSTTSISVAVNAGDRLSLDITGVGSTTPGGNDLLVTLL
jgi:hypothetical protein